MRAPVGKMLRSESSWNVDSLHGCPKIEQLLAISLVLSALLKLD